LAKFPSANVRRALHDALASNDNGLRLAAVLALAEMPDASDMEPLARCSTSSTGDGAPEIRFNTLRSASKIGGAAAVDVFMKGLLDGNAFVRHVAREELARIDPEAAQRAARLDLGSPSFALDAAEFERDLTELANELTEHDLLEPAATPMVDVVTTKGTLRFELFPGEAPLHVLNFLVLAQRDHYDGAPWHRVVPDFVIQGGDYRGDGNGGGTWRGPDQALRHEITPRKYVRGSLGMPRNEDIDSGGSQIFVTHRPTPHLDGRYTIFGELRAGFDVLDTIEVGDRILDVKRVR
jgi:cyclophilin family peptidyl-prolyl cis-trans isomerase